MKLADFDKIVCLAVDKRKDYWRHIEKEVKERGASVDFFVVGDGKLLPLAMYDRINREAPSSFQGFPNSYNAFCSYQTIVHRSFAAGLRNILLLEDDAEFFSDLDTVLESAGEQMKRGGIEWDVLHLGANHSWSATYEVSPNLLRIHGSLCWHAVALNESVFPEIMGWQPTLPIDLMAARMLHPTYKCFSLWPSVVIQKAGTSEVEGRFRNYAEYWVNKGNPCYSLQEQEKWRRKDA